MTAQGAVKKHLLRPALGVAVVPGLLGRAARWYGLPLLSRVEAMTCDDRLRLTMPRGVDPHIVIVDIDARRLSAEGRGYWPHTRSALRLDRLFDECHIKVLGFDVVFTEPGMSSGLKVLHELAQGERNSVPELQSSLQSLRPRLEYNRLCGAKLKGRPVVLGFCFTTDSNRANQPPAPLLPRGVFHGRNAAALSFSGYGANLPELQAAAARAQGPSRRRKTRTACSDGYRYSPHSAARTMNRCPSQSFA